MRKYDDILKDNEKGERLKDNENDYHRASEHTSKATQIM